MNPTTARTVLSRWAAEGRLVHEATGFARLDDATDGGPVYGTRWYITGAPNAGKTALLLEIMHRWALRGIAVGMLAVDEEDGDLVTRLAQRAGFTRHACEERDAGDLAAMGLDIGDLPIRFYGPTWTIERAAADLAAYAKEGGFRAALAIDSLQTVRCAPEELATRELSQPAAIEARVHAIRAMASEHKLIALCTSEMSRAGYAKRGKGEQIDAMAAAKWSGAVEYSARVLLSMRSIPGQSDVLELEIPKNKHGRERRASDDEALYLEIDRARQMLTECEKPADPVEDDEANDGRVSEMSEKLLAALVKANARGVSITGQRELRALVKGRTSVIQEAIAGLIASGRIDGGRGRPFAPKYEVSE